MELLLRMVLVFAKQRLEPLQLFLGIVNALGFVRRRLLHAGLIATSLINSHQPIDKQPINPLRPAQLVLVHSP